MLSGISRERFVVGYKCSVQKLRGGGQKLNTSSEGGVIKFHTHALYRPETLYFTSVVQQLTVKGSHPTFIDPLRFSQFVVSSGQHSGQDFWPKICWKKNVTIWWFIPPLPLDVSQKNSTPISTKIRIRVFWTNHILPALETNCGHYAAFIGYCLVFNSRKTCQWC